MSRRYFSMVLFLCLFLWVPKIVPAQDRTSAVGASSADCLAAVYADAVDRVEATGASPTFVMKNGARFIFDDGREKTFERLLDDPDLEDQFAFVYPSGETQTKPGENEDPGRIRHQAFFEAVYGKSESEVRRNLVRVDWKAAPKKRILFNRQQRAAEALARVGKALFDEGGESRRIARAVGGTFNRRTIAGTRRLSAHALGIAVDVDVQNSSYWRWSRTFPAFVNNIPKRVVAIFEANGFIWGGKWYHFDTMHFEFRPEMFCGTRSVPGPSS